MNVDCFVRDRFAGVAIEVHCGQVMLIVGKSRPNGNAVVNRYENGRHIRCSFLDSTFEEACRVAREYPDAFFMEQLL